MHAINLEPRKYKINEFKDLSIIKLIILNKKYSK
jgi:hypothetical protein